MSAAHPARRSAVDEAARLLQRHLRHHTGDLRPDPLFGRRLRGELLNRHVATREGTAPRTVPLRAEMGRLGRACLYASVLIGAGVGGTMAASQGALPGDALYPMKLEIEHLRLQALPAEHHDHLAAAMLSERVWELGMLVEAGDDAAAAAMAAPIQDAIDRMVAHGMLTSTGIGPVTPQLEILEGLIERLPAAAEAAIERRMEEAAIRVAERQQTPAPGRDRVTDEGGSAPNDRGLINGAGGTTQEPPQRGGGAEQAPGQVRDGPARTIDAAESED